MLSIRTQNKMALVPYNSFILIQDDYIDWETTEKNAIILNKVKLGTYSTKQRALEVLDEIEKALAQNDTTTYGHLNGYNENTLEYKCKLQTIYQMPDEDR